MEHLVQLQNFIFILFLPHILIRSDLVNTYAHQNDCILHSLYIFTNLISYKQNRQAALQDLVLQHVHQSATHDSPSPHATVTYPMRALLTQLKHAPVIVKSPKKDRSRGGSGVISMPAVNKAPGEEANNIFFCCVFSLIGILELCGCVIPFLSHCSANKSYYPSAPFTFLL